MVGTIENEFSLDSGVLTAVREWEQGSVEHCLEGLKVSLQLKGRLQQLTRSDVIRN